MSHSEDEGEYTEEEKQDWVESNEDGDQDEDGDGTDDDGWIAEECSDDDPDPVDEYVSEDYSDHFRTAQMWDTQEDLYKWARDIAEGLMIVLIKRSSNAHQITMVCERFGRAALLPTHQIHRSKSKKCSCRFEIIGVHTNKDIELGPSFGPPKQKWIIYVIEGHHNHRLLKTFNGKQVANFLQKLEYEDRGELTVTHWSMKFLAEHDYVVYPLRDKTINQIEILFFANKESLRLLKKFPYVVVIDATYKSNKYDMPLVQMVGFTCTHLTFNIGFAFTRAEKTFHYTWIMKRLRSCYEDLGLMPTAIMTDRELALINGIKEAFGSGVQHLLCWVNIRHNIKAHAWSILKREDKVEMFANQCWSLFCSRSEEVYEDRLARIRRTWKSNLVGYLEREWLTPYKENIVKVWTETHLHFFTITSKRVEGMNHILKEIIGSSRGGFNRVIVRIHHSIILQLDKVRESMNVSLSKKPRDFESSKIPTWIEGIFEPLFFKVSDRCFDLILESYFKVVRHEFTEECTDHWVRICQGLPCVHEIATAIIKKKPLTPDDVHDFWKQLEWEDTSTTSIHSSTMELARSRIREMWSKFQSESLKHSTSYQLGDMYHELKNPEQYHYPDQFEVFKKKGRLPGAKNKTRVLPKDKTLFENKEEEGLEYEKEKADEKKKTKEQASRGKTRSRPKKPERAKIVEEERTRPVEVMRLKDFQSHSSFQEVHTQDDTLPEEPIQPLVHLGVDFGVNNVDAFWIPYIIHARDVRSDGHCGYRSLAVLLGRQERDYISVRHEIVTELLENRDLYDPIRRALHAGSWEQLIMQVNYCLSPCSSEYWLHMPFIGLVFATLHQVGLVLLTWHAPTLCLPLRAKGTHNAPLTRIMAIAHVGRLDHFIPIALRDGSPLPQPPGAWRIYSDPDIRWWEQEFSQNLELYRSYRILYERQPDPWM